MQSGGKTSSKYLSSNCRIWNFLGFWILMYCRQTAHLVESDPSFMYRIEFFVEAPCSGPLKIPKSDSKWTRITQYCQTPRAKINLKLNLVSPCNKSNIINKNKNLKHNLQEGSKLQMSNFFYLDLTFWKKTYNERGTLMENTLWWKTTFDGRQPLMEVDRWWNTAFDGRRILMEDDLWWRSPFDGRHSIMEDNIWWKTTFHD